MIATRCARIGFDYQSESEIYSEVCTRRICIPLGPIHGESENITRKAGGDKTVEDDVQQPPVIARL